MKQLKVPVTESSALEYLETHPDEGSMLAYSDALNHFKIENAAVRIKQEDLVTLPTPFIAFSQIHGGTFSVVKSLSDSTMEWFDAQKGWVNDKLEEFTKTWSGVVLLAETDEKSGEKNYHQKRTAELLSKLRIPIAIGYIHYPNLKILIMKLLIFVVALFSHSYCQCQKIILDSTNTTKNVSRIYYEPLNLNTNETLIVKYYLNENEKKVLPLNKVNGKYEFSVKTNGEPIAMFFTIDLSLLTKFDDNLKKGYCILLNVKKSEDSVKAQLSKLKYSRKYFYFLNTNPTPFEEYGKEIESIKTKITPKEFEYFKLDFLNYKYSIEPEKHKQELLEYISTLSFQKDEDLQGYICAIYGSIFGDSAKSECINLAKMKILDSDINATDFTDSLENSN